jgi:hypothetical protein
LLFRSFAFAFRRLLLMPAFSFSSPPAIIDDGFFFTFFIFSRESLRFAAIFASVI